MGSLQESIRLGQNAILSNQQEHRMALASQDITLRAICTSVEFTMRRAAREQREGRGMLFDEMCAMEAPAPPVPFPQAEVISSSFEAGNVRSNCCPRVGEDEESESRTSELWVRRQCSLHSNPEPDFIAVGSRERWR